MDTADFRKRLASWDHPLGPFREPEDISEEMQQAALELGASAARGLADLAVAIDRERSPLGGVFIDFIEYYARSFPEALAEALLERLTSNGPPLVVFALGSTGSATASRHLLSTLDLNSADDDLLEALASTLGELGDSHSIEALRALRNRPGLSDRILNEINAALWDADNQ